MKKGIIYTLTLLIAIMGKLSAVYGQADATLSGKVTIKETKAILPGAVVYLVGTYHGGTVQADGTYTITDIKPGNYNLKVKYPGYAEFMKTGIKINPGKNTLDIIMEEQTVEKTVVIEGERPDHDLDDGNSKINVSSKDLKDMIANNIQDVVALQNGVQQTPDGIQIRGGRVYEVENVVDGANAQDPLAGTGFGLEVATNAVENVTVSTSGAEAEYGNGSSGVIASSIKEGGNKLTTSGSWQRDNLGKTHGNNSWNTDIFNFSLGTPIPGLKNKLTFFGSVSGNLSDLYYGPTANQLHSSLFSNSTIWAPRYDNTWSNAVKLAYKPNKHLKFTLTNLNSTSIGQSTRSLQIVGNDKVVTPGFQFPFSLNLDNATTYTQRSNLTILNFNDYVNKHWSFSVTASRLFTNLRADANGRPFRDSTVGQIYDGYSIVKDPVTMYNPDGRIIYVNPGPGLVNNNGITDTWHDHWVQEYSIKAKVDYTPYNHYHFFTFGMEHKEQEYQWVDITKPWVGAPIKLSDGTYTASTSTGSSSDIWHVKPASGGLFAQDNITYKGINAFIGMRFNYWAQGKYIDDAVYNPNSQIVDAVRAAYLNSSSNIAGRRFKGRLLPKLRVSFPITDNNVLYFNYGHSMRLPHPRFVYAGLDPVYQDRSFLSNLGNPNLNPEVTVSYELGLKSVINKHTTFLLTAFYNDKFDYIVSRTAIVKDATGRYVQKTFYINQDYARIRGLEASLSRSLGRTMKAVLNGSYQIATGKSNSALESSQQIQQNGFVSTSKENFLAWDRPYDLKFMLIFRPDTTLLKFHRGKSDSLPIRSWAKPLRNVRFYLTATYKSGLRYTPYEYTGISPTGRPMYEQIASQPYSKLGEPWKWIDFKITKDIPYGKNRFISFSFEIKNVLNNKNAQIIDPVTGKGYQYGDPLPYEVRDPKYPHPQDSGTPPDDPSRWLAPRQIFFGISYLF